MNNTPTTKITYVLDMMRHNMSPLETPLFPPNVTHKVEYIMRHKKLKIHLMNVFNLCESEMDQVLEQLEREELKIQ